MVPGLSYPQPGLTLRGLLIAPRSPRLWITQAGTGSGGETPGSCPDLVRESSEDGGFQQWTQCSGN